MNQGQLEEGLILDWSWGPQNKFTMCLVSKCFESEQRRIRYEMALRMFFCAQKGGLPYTPTYNTPKELFSIG